MSFLEIIKRLKVFHMLKEVMNIFCLSYVCFYLPFLHFVQTVCVKTYIGYHENVREIFEQHMKYLKTSLLNF